MFHPGQHIRLKGSARTNTGRVRDNNEDSVHLWTTHTGHIALAIVADGMGGAVAGEEASRIAVEAIQTELTLVGKQMADNHSGFNEDDMAEHLVTVIREANDHIVNEASQHPELKGMGTTVTMAFIRDTELIIGHVGDSRAYRIDGDSGDIEQITSDHSFVQALVAAGHITEDEAEEHPMRNVLYRALGQARDVEVDVYYERLNIGDRLVLCSDGLTLHVKPHEIAELAMATDEPSESSLQMIDLANQRGGRDNVSVIIIKVEGAEEMTEPRIEAHDTRPLDDAPPEQDDFGPSESSNYPQEEQPDSPIKSYKGIGSDLLAPYLPLSRDLVVTHDSDEILGEGRDSGTPD